MKLWRLLTSLLAAAAATMITTTPVQAGPVSGLGSPCSPHYLKEKI